MKICSLWTRHLAALALVALAVTGLAQEPMDSPAAATSAPNSGENGLGASSGGAPEDPQQTGIPLPYARSTIGSPAASGPVPMGPNPAMAGAMMPPSHPSMMPPSMMPPAPGLAPASYQGPYYEGSGALGMGMGGGMGMPGMEMGGGMGMPDSMYGGLPQGPMMDGHAGCCGPGGHGHPGMGGPMTGLHGAGPLGKMHHGGSPYGMGHGAYEDGMIGRALRRLLPYAGGGRCNQRWFDIHMEGVHLTRDVSRQMPFTAQGLMDPPDIVLSTDDLEFDDQAGLRFTGAVQLGPGSILEMGYMGLVNHADSAEVFDPEGFLYSVVSEFGLSPFDGFEETDRSFLQRIAYSSQFDTFELNVRHRWVGPNCRVQGSWLMGVRYFWLREDFVYSTRGDERSSPLPVLRFADFTVSTQNSLTGFQTGGDLWTTIMPGLKVGAEVKGGIYGNRAKQNTLIDTNTFNLFETASTADLAWIGELNLMAIYRLSYSWTARLGYTMLYVDNVALAPENFNPVPPEAFFPPPGVSRVVGVDDDGHVFYRGLTAGLEWMW